HVAKPTRSIASQGRAVPLHANHSLRRLAQVVLGYARVSFVLNRLPADDHKGRVDRVQAVERARQVPCVVDAATDGRYRRPTVGRGRTRRDQQQPQPAVGRVQVRRYPHGAIGRHGGPQCLTEPDARNVSVKLTNASSAAAVISSGLNPLVSVNSVRTRVPTAATKELNASRSASLTFSAKDEIIASTERKAAPMLTTFSRPAESAMPLSM